MDIHITEKENALLQRKELTGTIDFKGPTPSNADVQAELAKKLGVGNELVVVKHIYTAYGVPHARFEAFAYATKEQREKLEGKLPEPEKKEEAQAEKPAEAPKAEEKKEEAPAEEKKEEAPKPAEEKPAEAE